MRRYHQSRFRQKKSIELPDLELLDGVVSPVILDALKKSSKQLDKANIRHALIGGLAVGAYGHPRATRDVDYLVGDEAFKFHGGGLVTFNSQAPIAIGDVAVDLLGICEDESYLNDGIEDAVLSGGIPIISISVLFYLKLKAFRSKDIGDLVELVKSGIDTDEVEDYLKCNAYAFLTRFKKIIRLASEEE